MRELDSFILACKDFGVDAHLLASKTDARFADIEFEIVSTSTLESLFSVLDVCALNNSVRQTLRPGGLLANNQTPL